MYFSLDSQKFCPYTIRMKPKPGRPPKSGDKPMGERLEIRLEAGEKEVYDKAARAVGLDRSEWIRAVLNAAAHKILPTGH